jgi:aspartate kinase
MLMAHGFLHRIFEIFDRYETAVDMLATTEVSVSLTIDNAERLEEICAELRPFAEVSSEAEQAIVCVVGDNIRRTPGVAARAFGALEDINVRMISQGASRLNLSFVVAGRDASRAVRLLHQDFFREADAALFDVSDGCTEVALEGKRVSG